MASGLLSAASAGLRDPPSHTGFLTGCLCAPRPEPLEAESTWLLMGEEKGRRWVGGLAALPWLGRKGPVLSRRSPLLCPWGRAQSDSQGRRGKQLH